MFVGKDSGQTLKVSFTWKGSGWKAIADCTEVRVSTTEAGKIGLFYDDGIFLVNRQTGDAIPIFAVQVKSGDWSAGTVIEQIKNDKVREKIENAKIIFDGVD